MAGEKSFGNSHYQSARHNDDVTFFETWNGEQIDRSPPAVPYDERRKFFRLEKINQTPLAA